MPGSAQAVGRAWPEASDRSVRAPLLRLSPYFESFCSMRTCEIGVGDAQCSSTGCILRWSVVLVMKAKFRGNGTNSSDGRFATCMLDRALSSADKVNRTRGHRTVSWTSWYWRLKTLRNRRSEGFLNRSKATYLDTDWTCCCTARST